MKIRSQSLFLAVIGIFATFALNRNGYSTYRNPEDALSRSWSTEDGFRAPLVFSDDFSSDPNASGLWTIFRGDDDPVNEASWDSANQQLFLTRNIDWKSSAIFANYELTANAWIAEFDFLGGGGDGADGFVFMFYKDESAYLTQAPGKGGYLGFQPGFQTSISGYGIEFDNYKNTLGDGGIPDPSEHHVAVVKDTVADHLAYVETGITEDNAWHHAKIDFNGGQILVWVDQVLILSHFIPNFDSTYSGVGFSSATGNKNNNHVIDNFELSAFSAAKPPLIIVHGWQGLSPGFSCGVPERFDGSNSTLGGVPDLPSMFQADYDVWIAFLDSGFSATASLNTNGNCLADQVEQVLLETGQLPVLVAHSMGGLVSRACTRHSRCDVKALYTMGSPHAGINSVFAIKLMLKLALNHFGSTLNVGLCLWQTGLCDMASTKMVVFNQLNQNQNDIEYGFIGGYGDSTFFLQDVLAIPEGLNDGLIGRYSAVGWAWPLSTFVPPGWTSQSGQLTQYWLDEVHIGSWGDAYYEGYLPDSTSRSYHCIQYLEGNENLPPYCQEATEHVEELPQNANETQFTPMLEGTLPSGGSTTHFVNVDGTDSGSFILFYKDGPISFTLTRPDGQLIDPPYAAANPDEVSHQTISGSPEMSPGAAYVFASTMPGAWKLHVDAGNLGAGETRYLTFITQETSRTLSVGSDEPAYAMGESASLTAVLTGPSGGIAGATVIATINRPDGNDDLFVLNHTGGGVYYAEYLLPELTGQFLVTITAEGSDGEVSFEREADLIIEISPMALYMPIVIR